LVVSSNSVRHQGGLTCLDLRVIPAILEELLLPRLAE
jgi:hypothetical protein